MTNRTRSVLKMADTAKSGGRSKPARSEAGKGSHYFALPVGTKLLEYEIEDLLGHGGFGITYRAKDTVLRESVAIKEYLPNDIAVRVSDETVRAKSESDDEDFQTGLKSFLEEARVITRFRHPNIVHVRRFFELHGTGYIALDYERGQTLSKRLADGPIAEPELRNILFGILDGLETIHDQAVLHRDIKPSNIILRDDGTPVLIDFGAARDFRERHSRSITAIAAPGYSPPEQYGVGGQQGPWTDFYALGAIAYKCVTDNAPVDSLRRLRNDPLVPAAKAATRKYSRDLLRAIDWMLAVDEAKRPHAAQQLRDLLGSNPRTSRRAPGFKFERQRSKLIPALAALLLLTVAGATGLYNYESLRGLLTGASAPAPTSAANQPAPGTASKAEAGDKSVPANPAEPAVAAKSASPPGQAASAPASPPKPAGPDDLAWDLMKDTGDADQLRMFVQQFPNSAHRAAAIAKLTALGQPAPRIAPSNSTSSPPPATVVSSAPAAAPASLPAVRPPASAADDIAWDIFKNSDDVALLQQFIDRYPASRHRAEAQTRIAALQSAKTAKPESKTPDTTIKTPAAVAPNADQTARSVPVTDPLAINEIRTRLYELNFDPGPGNRTDLLLQAIREFENTIKVAQTGQLTTALLQRLRQTPPLQPWGSIVYARPTEKWGMSWGHETRREAVASARANCGEACPAEVSFFGNECAAFAHSNTSWAIVSRATVETARNDALNDCRKNGKACTIIATVCANGSGRAKDSR